MRLRRIAPAFVLTVALFTLPVAAEPATASPSTPNVVDIVTNLWHALVDLLVEGPVDQDKPSSPEPAAPLQEPPPGPDDGDEVSGYAEPGG